MENIDDILIHTNKIIKFDDESIIYRNGFLDFLEFVKDIGDNHTVFSYQELKMMFLISGASDVSDKYREGVEDAVSYLEGKSPKRFKMTEYFTEGAISLFTFREREAATKYCEQHKEDIKKFDFEENSGKITTKDGFIVKFALLSSFLEDFDEIDEETKNELESRERLEKCHSGSIDIAQTFSYPCSIVTGYIHGVSSKDKILHSWIEFQLGSREMAIDYTLNVIMDRSSYIRLHKAEEIKRISSKALKNDIKLGILHKLGIFCSANLKDRNRVIIASQKEYLLFREQILKDLMNSNAEDIDIKKEDIEL